MDLPEPAISAETAAASIGAELPDVMRPATKAAAMLFAKNFMTMAVRLSAVSERRGDCRRWRPYQTERRKMVVVFGKRDPNGRFLQRYACEWSKVIKKECLKLEKECGSAEVMIELSVKGRPPFMLLSFIHCPSRDIPSWKVI